MGNFWLKTRNWFLLGGDVLLLYGSLALALFIRYPEKFFSAWWLHLVPFSLIFFLWVIVFYISGFYDLRRAKNQAQFFLQLLLIISLAGLIGMAVFYLWPSLGISPKTNLALTLALATVFLFAWRLLFNSLVSQPQKKILLIGEHTQSIELATQLNNHPQWGYQVAAIITPEKFIDYKDKLHNLGISSLVISDDLYQTQTLTDALYDSLSSRVEMYTLTKFYEHLVKKIPLSVISKVWFLDNLTERDKMAFDKIKRLVDIVLSFVGLIVSLPFYPLLYLLVKFDSSGPFLYTQVRLGKLGRPFVIVKIRSMVQNAEKNGAEWAVPGDARVTRMGKIFRKIRLDELPQLFNVLWGEMSFVGPRPERPEFINQLEEKIPYYKQRLLVKPGLTGWAQVNFKYSSDIEGALEKLQYDLYYIKNRSLFLDLTILLKTVNMVLKGGGH